MDRCNTVAIVLCFLLSAVLALTDLTSEERTYVDAYNDGNEKPTLIYDKAWLTFNNSETFDLIIYAHNHECWTCDAVQVAIIPGKSVITIIVNTTFGTDMHLLREIVSQNTLFTICSFTMTFRERGDYWIFFNQSNYVMTYCDIGISNDPSAAEMRMEAILYAAIGVAVLWIIIKVIAICYRKRVVAERKYTLGIDNTAYSGSNMEMRQSGDESTEEPPNTHSKRQRLHSLDTFRGLSLVVMLFVNYGGGGYWFFDHLPWNGLTFADLVFPWFVFIMGVSMNFSFRGMLKRGTSKLRVLVKVLKRTALLFFFGIVMNTNWGPVDLEKLRVPGVLQRLSLSYMVVALMETAFAKAADRGKDKSWAWLRDIVYLLPEWITSLCILATYLALTFAMPVPGCPTGYIGPGGLHDGKQFENCTGGAGAYIDKLVLGYDHIYANPTPKTIYDTKVPYDPEGILGTLCAAFLCFLGLQAGRIFLTYKTHCGRLIRLVIWGIIVGAIGAGLCGVSKNDGIIPVNKNLWSISYTLVTASFGFFLLSALFIVVDVFKLWGGEPFVFAGMNPLTLYLCHDIFYRFFPVNFQVELVHWKLLLKALWDVLIWLTLAFVLYTKKIFIAL